MNGRILALMLLLIVSGWATAGEVKGLYNAQVALDMSTSQQQAAQQGLAQVLVKISGSYTILKEDMVQRQMRSATDFILSYQINKQQQQRVYNASYDSGKVDQLIRNSGFPIWGSTRPAILFWLAEQQSDTFNRVLISEQADSSLKKEIQQFVQLRGLDLGFPLIDLDDLMQVSVYDVWGRFAENISMASSRYDADAVLIARIYEHKEQLDNVDELLNKVVWRIDWSLINRGQQTNGSVEHVERQQVIAQLINSVADELASRYAIEAQSNGTGEPIELVVNNVSSLQIHEDIMQFFNQLSAVTDITLIKLAGRKGTFRLRLLGDEADLRTALQLDDRIQRVVDEFGQPVPQLEFVWAP
ncbi:DUF2066 domain-containing protein [Alteromonadaceae bacterium BrNp21-10]|nr:DUF2066 domain-containing protein [Alteromonadaceae bacterium BrNp21-10]